MIIYCGQCGHSNQADDAFCGSCGVHLAWQGSVPSRPERTMAGPPPAPPVVLAHPQPPRQELNPGDLVCERCGEGSAPTRHFCRHCGTALPDAPVAWLRWWEWLGRWLRKLQRG
jgi:hypothetical protein